MSVSGIIAVIASVFVVLIIALEILRSRYVLSVTRKIIPMDVLPESFDGTKIAVVGDLHQMRFGQNNEILAKKIKLEEPDYIFFVGDMGDSRKFNVDAFYDLLETLGNDIPLLMVPGNHDLRLGNGKVHKNFLSEISSAGAVLLDNACAELVAGESKMYVYGFCQPLEPQENVSIRKWKLAGVGDNDVLASLGRCPADAPVLLMAHDPQYFPVYARWGASLVLSGHTHGGMLRIPFAGGVFGTNGKLFPKFCAGLYAEGQSRLFVTRGLGASVPLRFGNPPEIAVLTLCRPESVRKQASESAKSQLDQVAEALKSDGRALKALLRERSNQLSDMFARLTGKKQSRFSKIADARKKRNTYTVESHDRRVGPADSEPNVQVTRHVKKSSGKKLKK